MRIDGKKTYLREIQEEDLEVVRCWRNDPEINKFFFNRSYITQEKQREWFQELTQSDTKNFFIICDKVDRRPLGTIQWEILGDGKRCAEIGIYIGEKDATGKGYGSDAMRAAIGYLLGDGEMETVRVTALESNQRALEFYKSLGFREISSGEKHGERVRFMEIRRQNSRR
jgi:RimJ/RimL family protein N-acetyltransferase